MNGLIDDITADGWMALCISILRGLPPDEAFRLLYNPARRNVKWNEEMFEEIELMRQKGMKWADIGAMYQVDGTTVCKSYYRFKGKKKREYQRHDEEFYNEIHRLRQQGVKWDDIAERMGLSTSRLCSLYGYWKKRNAE